MEFFRKLYDLLRHLGDDAQVDADLPPRHGADREQQRITGQERRHNQPGFAEDDGEEDDVEVVQADEIDHRTPFVVLAEVAEQVVQLAEEFHLTSPVSPRAKVAEAAAGGA